MLKVLQIATVVIFALMIIFGVGIVIAAPDRIGAYGQLVGFILPAWLTSITAALLGRPITDAAAGLRAKLEAGKQEGITAELSNTDQPLPPVNPSGGPITGGGA